MNGRKSGAWRIVSGVQQSPMSHLDVFLSVVAEMFNSFTVLLTKNFVWSSTDLFEWGYDMLDEACLILVAEQGKIYGVNRMRAPVVSFAEIRGMPDVEHSLHLYANLSRDVSGWRKNWEQKMQERYLDFLLTSNEDIKDYKEMLDQDDSSQFRGEIPQVPDLPEEQVAARHYSVREANFADRETITKSTEVIGSKRKHSSQTPASSAASLTNVQKRTKTSELIDDVTKKGDANQKNHEAEFHTASKQEEVTAAAKPCTKIQSDIKDTEPECTMAAVPSKTSEVAANKFPLQEASQKVSPKSSQRRCRRSIARRSILTRSAGPVRQLRSRGPVDNDLLKGRKQKRNMDPLKAGKHSSAPKKVQDQDRPTDSKMSTIKVPNGWQQDPLTGQFVKMYDAAIAYRYLRSRRVSKLEAAKHKNTDSIASQAKPIVQINTTEQSAPKNSALSVPPKPNNLDLGAKRPKESGVKRKVALIPETNVPASDTENASNTGSDETRSKQSVKKTKSDRGEQKNSAHSVPDLQNNTGSDAKRCKTGGQKTKADGPVPAQSADSVPESSKNMASGVKRSKRSMKNNDVTEQQNVQGLKDSSADVKHKELHLREQTNSAAASHFMKAREVRPSKRQKSGHVASNLDKDHVTANIQKKAQTEESATSGEMKRTDRKAKRHKDVRLLKQDEKMVRSEDVATARNLRMKIIAIKSENSDTTGESQWVVQEDSRGTAKKKKLGRRKHLDEIDEPDKENVGKRSKQHDKETVSTAVKVEAKQVSAKAEPQDQDKPSNSEDVSMTVGKQYKETFKKTEKVFKCDQCSKAFSHKKTLVHHVQNIHNKVVRFNCNKCGKGFYAKSPCDAHEARCLNEKKFACGLCHQKFYTASDVTQHVKNSHSEGEKLKCLHCEKTFQTKETLRVHLMNLQRDRKYICKLCKEETRVFAQYQGLYKHYKKHHPENLADLKTYY